VTIQPEHWPRVKAVFNDALRLRGAARETYLADACRDDALVREHVERLLASHGEAESFLEQPAAAVLGVHAPHADVTGHVIGAYRVEARLGAGGMGEVYKAHDTRLDRPVALKLLPPRFAADAERLRRFHAEGRAASSLNHPHIVVVHDFGDADGRPFIVTEFVEGQTLRQRLQGGPCSLRETVDIVAQVAGALAAAHARGIVHRDIKPENVMLRPDGHVKVLDFGVAKLTAAADADAGASVLRTEPGRVVGTPRYMSPEQASGGSVDARSDVFALGTVAYEMLAGRPPFGGDIVVEVMHAILHDEPPALVGSAAIAAVDRVLHRAMSKRPADRYQSAPELASDLRAAGDLGDAGETPQVRALTRLIVLPFDALRPDAETDFLTFSLPDALASSLSGLGSLVVKSRQAAATAGTSANPAPDLRRIAADAGVDILLTGTLLRSGDELRVTAQLVDGASGRLLWTHTANAAVGDVFRLQDLLVERVVESLELTLTARENRLLKLGVPNSAKAYEFYLRANQISHGARWWLDMDTWKLARDLYLACLEEDARFAPAWAALGRVYRIVAKYAAEDTAGNVARAEEAFKRALELNPDLPVVQNLYAQLESDLGRARESMVRLIEHARVRANDPELFTALCHACRYCGLLDASLAAHERAARLDPKVLTSVAHTHFVRGDYARVVEIAERSFGGYGFIGVLSLAAIGRQADALAATAQMQKTAPPRMLVLVVAARAIIEGARAEIVAALDEAIETVMDPDGSFYIAREFARIGETRRAIEALERMSAAGYCAYSTLAGDAAFDALRRDAGFETILGRMRDVHHSIVEAFREAGGPGVLGDAFLKPAPLLEHP
jgi:serine/threonine protein kinase/tetratricopeptide (TPR) repeat protein